MNGLAAFQRDFLVAITAAEPPKEPGLKIHHDTWLLGLIEVLRESLPVTAEVLGDEAFNAFARDFVRSHPLRGGDRNGYGEGFADLLQVHPHLPAPWLPDLVRFEQALNHAHVAPDAQSCTFEDLLDPQARVVVHPSVRLLSLSHDVRNVAAGEVRPVTCDLLIGRDRDDEVVRLCLAPYELDFLELLGRHHTLAPVLERLDPSEDDMALLQTLLARLVQSGLLTSQKDTA